MKQKKDQSKIKKYALFILAAAIVVGLSYWVLSRYTTVFDFSSKANQIPGIDYSPAKPSDNEKNNEAKKSEDYGNNPENPMPTDSSIGITLAAAGQDQGGGPVIVKVLLQNINDGVCRLALKQGQKVIEKTGSVTRQNNYYTCDGFSIPFSDVQVGGAQLTLTVTATNGASNNVSTDITIK